MRPNWRRPPRQNLKRIGPKEDRVESIHHLMLPQPIEAAENPDIERAVEAMQKVINIGRKIREQHNKSLKQVRAPRGATPRSTRSHIHIHIHI